MTLTVAVVALALALAPGRPPRPVVYVQADVARLRLAPDEGAELVARYRIGARLRLIERSGAWLQVIGDDGGPVGWVAEGSVAPEPPSVDALLAEAGKASGAERVRWLERAAALDGARRQAWEALLAAYRAGGPPARAAHAAAVLDGRAPVRVAACYGGTWVLVADWAPGRALASEAFGALRGEKEVKAEADRLAREALELGGVAWWADVGGKVTLIPAERIRPYVEAIDREPGTLQRLVLGQCGDDGVAFSQPVVRQGGEGGAPAAWSPALAPGRWRITVERVGPQAEAPSAEARPEEAQFGGESAHPSGEETSGEPEDCAAGVGFDVKAEAGGRTYRTVGTADVPGC